MKIHLLPVLPRRKDAKWSRMTYSRHSRNSKPQTSVAIPVTAMTMPLDDERIQGNDMECFVMFSDQLPFIGRGSELNLLEDRIKKNIKTWTMWKATKSNPHLVAKADEVYRRTYQHPAVATGPGRGKTTLMQRDMLYVTRKHFKDVWSGRAFSWDLEAAIPTDAEERLMRDCSIASFQCVSPLRILHRAINHNSSYTEMLTDLARVLDSLS
jgi:hypothetical protein